MKAQGIIALAGLWFSYNGSDRAVLKNLTLEIPSGSITAILGPNGSGKTTLLRLILGTLTPQQGTILLAGQPQVSYSRREMSRLIGLVPQDEYIPFNFSVLEYVLLGRSPHLGPLERPRQADHQIAWEALQATGLTHLIDRSISGLSGGERQLAVVARALAQKPHILLLDEPTAHLDLGNAGRVLQILRTLSGDGTGLLMTTHDPNLAAAVANYVVLMREGKVVDAGSVESELTSEKLSATYGVPVKVLQVGSGDVIVQGFGRG